MRVRPPGRWRFARLQCAIDTSASLAYGPSVPPLHTVAETGAYLRDAKAAGVSDEERERIVREVSADPEDGDLIVGSGGIRKRRIAGRGKGKSGGYRIMVAYVGPDVPAYLLALLGKGDRENFSAAEIAAMSRMTAQLREHWSARRRMGLGAGAIERD